MIKRFVWTVEAAAVAVLAFGAIGASAKPIVMPTIT